MNERQFRQMLTNQRRRGLGRARDLHEQMASILRTSADQSRRMEALAEQWQRVAKPGWLDGTSIVSIEEGVATFQTPSPALRFELSRQASRLSRELSRRVPGLRSLRFVPFDSGAVRPELDRGEK